LFSVIGTTYGAGDSLTTFAVPDLRGMFVRGFDNGRGIDPLRVFGTQQAGSFQSHNHNGVTGAESAHRHAYSGTTGTDSPDHTHNSNGTAGLGQGAAGPNTVQQSGGSQPTSGASARHTHSFSGTTAAGSSHTHSISSSGGTETRPINVAMNYIIKT